MTRKSYFSNVHKSLPSLYALHDTNIFPITSAVRFLIHRHHHIIAAPMISRKSYFSSKTVDCRSVGNGFSMGDELCHLIENGGDCALFRIKKRALRPFRRICTRPASQCPQIATIPLCPLRHEHFPYHVRVKVF